MKAFIPLIAGAVIASVSNAFTNIPSPSIAGVRSIARPLRMTAEQAAGSADRREFLVNSAKVATAGAAISALPGSASAARSQAWTAVELPASTTLFDLDFDTKDPNHGFLVGSKGTFLETFDAGETWGVRTFSQLDAEEEITYRFEKVSFLDGEAWIIGKPSILLHSKDEGRNWERIPLSPKLPGEPCDIVATGAETAEMTTSAGAIYYTSNAARNFKAQVKETIDATLNRISSSGVSGASYFTGSIIGTIRDSTGAYLAVSSRGNFYLTWQPGDDFWIPHNRGTSRRIQQMGFVQDDLSKGLWMTLNGGVLQISKTGQDVSNSDVEFKAANIKTGGYGITDVAWKDENEVWAVGGGGTMFVSVDGGKNFVFNNAADDIPGNLYNVKFFKNGKGFVLGSDGILLKYRGKKTA